MLFLDSKVLNHTVNDEARITLLHALQKRDFKPVIRSLRIHCFEELLIEADKLADVETSIARWTVSSSDEPFVVGDLFAFEDHLLYLIFEDEGFVTAGIVYETETAAPFRKLNATRLQIFRRKARLRFALHKLAQGDDGQANYRGVFSRR